MDNTELQTLFKNRKYLNEMLHNMSFKLYEMNKKLHYKDDQLKRHKYSSQEEHNTNEIKNKIQNIESDMKYLYRRYDKVNRDINIIDKKIDVIMKI